MNGNATMRRKLLRKVLQNSFCGIFDSFIVDNLFRRVDQSHIYRAILAALVQDTLVEAVSLFGAAAQQIAHVSSLMVLFGDREENLDRETVVALGKYDIAKRIDKPAVAVLE